MDSLLNHVAEEKRDEACEKGIIGVQDQMLNGKEEEKLCYLFRKSIGVFSYLLDYNFHVLSHNVLLKSVIKHNFLVLGNFILKN